MMECSMVQGKLHEYIFGELDCSMQGEIEEHINNCSCCCTEYMELKKLLIDDMEDFIRLKENIVPPGSLMADIKNSIKPKKPRYSIVKYAAAACLLFSLIFTTPVLAYYITQIPALNKYADLDNNIMTDFEEGRGQLVEKSDTLQGVTFTVDGIISGQDKTTILFTVKVPKSERINYGIPLSGLNVMTVTDQFGTSYRIKSGAMTVKSVNDDGEAKCIFEVEPLHFWSYKLNIRITAIELGHYGETIEDIKNIYGSWDVSFYINRSGR